MDNPSLGWEKAVLGTGLAYPDAMEEAGELLPSDFSIEAHQVLWAEMLSLRRRQALDHRAVVESLRSTDQLIVVSDAENIGEDYIAELMTHRGASMGEYAARVLDMGIKRELRKVAALIRAEAEDENVDAQEAMDSAEKRLLGLRRNKSGNGSTMADLISVFNTRLAGLLDGTVTPAWVPHLEVLREVVEYADAEDFIVIAARPGDGKCLGGGTRVVMYNGSLRAVEEIRVGDLLMGPNQAPRSVCSVTSGQAMMYWVRQNRGIDYRVNQDHILSLKRSKNEDQHEHGEVLNISVHDLLAKSNSFLARWKGYKVAIEFPEQEVELEPYFLGLWLGDGTSSNSNITNIDPEIIGYLQDYARRRGAILHSHRLSHRITRKHGDRNSVQSLLRALDLLNNKHIPDLYLRNSRHVRLELLAGIVDSDGCRVHNGIEVTMQNVALVEQIKFLADTLGFRTSPIYQRTVRCQTGAERLAYRISIHGDFSECPIRVLHKRPENGHKRVDWRVTGIHVEEDKIDDYYGFTLDGDGLFLLEDMTVTHNSSLMRYEFLHAAMNGVPALIFNLENSPIEYAKFAIAMISGIDSDKLKSPRKLNEEDKTAYKEAAEYLATKPLYVESLAAPSGVEVERIARSYISQKHIKLIGLDYIQLVKNGKESKVEDVTETCGILRSIPLRYGVPLIAAAQLSRGIVHRGENAEPNLADLRESGAIEQDATLVFFPRPVWANPTDAQLRTISQNLIPNTSQLYPTIKALPYRLYVKKNRNGGTGTTRPVLWVRSTNNFYTIQRGD